MRVREGKREGEREEEYVYVLRYIYHSNCKLSSEVYNIHIYIYIDRFVRTLSKARRGSVRCPVTLIGLARVHARFVRTVEKKCK